jgi:alpha-glucoside transport system permease protein
MAKKTLKTAKQTSAFWNNFVLIIICIIWLVPILGILITSFRPSEEIFRSGWWQVFPHKENVEVERIVLPESVDLDGEFEILGKTATFEEFRNTVELDDGRLITWYGNKRTRTAIISENRWVGFATNLTTKNYSDVLGGKTISYKNAEGQTITRTGNNLGGAFLNSLAVTIPGTIIPILIAAFAAFGFAWL